MYKNVALALEISIFVYDNTVAPGLFLTKRRNSTCTSVEEEQVPQQLNWGGIDRSIIAVSPKVRSLAISQILSLGPIEMFGKRYEALTKSALEEQCSLQMDLEARSAALKAHAESTSQAISWLYSINCALVVHDFVWLAMVHDA